jgi:chaperonin cofactor prefoldin
VTVLEQDKARVEQRMEKVETKVASLEGDKDRVEQRVEQRVEKVEMKVASLEGDKDRVEQRVEKLQKELEGTKPAYDVQVLRLNCMM